MEDVFCLLLYPYLKSTPGQEIKHGLQQQLEISDLEKVLQEAMAQEHPDPDPWADPKSKSTLGLYNLNYRSIGVQNWGFHLFDPPGGRGRDHGVFFRVPCVWDPNIETQF